MRLFVSLTSDEFECLKALAQTERRRPQDQAAVLLSRAISTPRPVHSLAQQPERGSRRQEERREHTPST